jgi:hypothetical protein
MPANLALGSTYVKYIIASIWKISFDYALSGFA